MTRLRTDLNKKKIKLVEEMRSYFGNKLKATKKNSNKVMTSERKSIKREQGKGNGAGYYGI